MNGLDVATPKANGIVKPEGETQPTQSAATEAVRIADGTLRRVESVKAHIHWAGVTILWSVIIGVLLLAAIWLYHLATPDKIHFLTTAQVGNIQTILLSVVGSSFATQAGRSWLNPSGDKDNSNQ